MIYAVLALAFSSLLELNIACWQQKQERSRKWFRGAIIDAVLASGLGLYWALR